MFHLELPVKGTTEVGARLFVCCQRQSWRGGGGSLLDKVVEPGKAIAAKALPVLVGFLFVGLPWGDVSLNRWRCGVPVVDIAVRRPVAVSPAVTGPWLTVPLNLWLFIPGRWISVIRRLHIPSSSETPVRRSDFPPLPRSSLDKVVKSRHPVAAKSLPVVVPTSLQKVKLLVESLGRVSYTISNCMGEIHRPTMNTVFEIKYNFEEWLDLDWIFERGCK